MAEEADVQLTAEALVPVLYQDLRRMARRTRWRASAGATLQTTALVHEAFLKLRRSAGFNDRQHFMRAAAIAMRQILVNLARESLAAKRGGGADRVPLDDAPEIADAGAQSLIDVDEALARLHLVEPRLAQVVECRFFAGYSEEETAAALGLSDRSVRREWVKARAWLRHDLGPATDAPVG